MKKEINIERSEMQIIHYILPYPGFCFNIFSNEVFLIFLLVVSSLRIVFQPKFWREFREVGGFKVKELEQFKTKRMY